MTENEDTLPANATVVDGFTVPSLPKWPAHVVVGKSVTPEQARAVIIRTTATHYLNCNDREWNRKVHAAFGFEVSDIGYPISPCWSADDHEHYYNHQDGRTFQRCSPVNRRIMQDLGILPLSYIQNDRIASSYIGGPNGWMGWDGTVHQTGTNVGKWPSCGEVLQDWSTVAQAFPFLDLTATLWSGEQCEEDSLPVVSYRVKGGHVTMGPPSADTEKPNDDPFDEGFFMRRFMDVTAERGCTIGLLNQAIEDARVSAKANPVPAA